MNARFATLVEMPWPLLFSVVVGGLHTLFYLGVGGIFVRDATIAPAFRQVALLMAGAALLMAICLALPTWALASRKRAGRAPLLVLFVCEAMAYLVTIGNFALWVNLLGLLAAPAAWGLLTAQTRAYLGVADRPDLFDD
ncbi:MAG: hypothetical protein Q4P36_06835 [Bowdeniella nasicola]|nr:hypothetical protein [Bowdeniella nasicola]